MRAGHTGGHPKRRGSHRHDAARCESEEPHDQGVCARGAGREDLLDESALLITARGAVRRHESPDAEKDREEAVRAPLHVTADCVGSSGRWDQQRELSGELRHRPAECGALHRRVTHDLVEAD